MDARRSYAYHDVPEGRRRNPRITPARALLLVALVVSMGVAVYAGFLDRSASQVPILGSALAVLGLTLLGFAAIGGRAAVQAGREGDGGRAFGAALLGGLCAVAAAGALGAAFVLVLLWSTAPRVT